MISNFEVTKEMSNRANLGRLVNLEGCDLNTIKGFELLLSGRSRFYASVLTELAELEPNGGNLTKQEVLTMAIQRSIANHRKKLVERFSMALSKTTWKGSVIILLSLVTVITNKYIGYYIIIVYSLTLILFLSNRGRITEKTICCSLFLRRQHRICFGGRGE